jgi:hypothetical protein
VALALRRLGGVLVDHLLHDALGDLGEELAQRVGDLRDQHRRYPALRAELDRYLSAR